MLKVIGAGFGRTGTHSLGLALDRLGLGPCYHLLEVAKNPGHAEMWLQALDGKPLDWGQLFAGYTSTVEWPGAAFFAELAEYFPDAKVILTLRDPGSWFESASETIFEGLELSAQNPDPLKRASSQLQRRLILERTFAGRYWEQEYAIEVYQQHIHQVVERIPKERLLLWNVKAGWKPLCEFLQKPTPTQPFPWLNERNEFLASAPEWAKKIRDEKRQKRS